METGGPMPNSRQPGTGTEDEHAGRVGEILNDLLDRRRRGESLSDADVRARHPEFADELLAHLNVLTDVRPGDPIDQLISRGVLEKCSDSQEATVFGPFRITGFLETIRPRSPCGGWPAASEHRCRARGGRGTRSPLHRHGVC